jgi:hypothetical protein
MDPIINDAVEFLEGNFYFRTQYLAELLRLLNDDVSAAAMEYMEYMVHRCVAVTSLWMCF